MSDLENARRVLAREIHSRRTLGRQDRIREAADEYFRLLDATRNPGWWPRLKSWIRRSELTQDGRSGVDA